MSKRTYVCFNCRTTKRADAAYGLNTEYRCALCQGELAELPWRWRVPKKDKDAEWDKLRQMVNDTKQNWLPRRYARGKTLLAKYDRIIEDTMRRKDSQSKQNELKKLRWKRQEIEKKYIGE